MRLYIDIITMDVEDTKMLEFNSETSKDLDPIYKYGSGKKRKRSEIEKVKSTKSTKLAKKRKHTSNGDSSDSDSDSGDESESEIDLEGVRGMIKGRLGDMFGPKHDDKGKLNHIYFDDSVNKASCRKLIAQIDELNKKIGKLN